MFCSSESRVLHLVFQNNGSFGLSTASPMADPSASHGSPSSYSAESLLNSRAPGEIQVFYSISVRLSS